MTPSPNIYERLAEQSEGPTAQIHRDRAEIYEQQARYFAGQEKSNEIV